MQGEGSLVSVSLDVEPKANISSGQYIVYTTYDQGSVKRVLPVMETGAPKHAQPIDIWSEFMHLWNENSTWLSIVYAIAAVVGLHRTTIC